MEANRHATASAPTRRGLGQLLAGGTTGNERLTAATGAVLLVLLAALGVTIIAIGRLLWMHLFIGMLLIGPLGLKLASTGYRFGRYYTGNHAYRRKGAPLTPLRLLAPLVVVSTVVVSASGVALLLAGPSSRGALLPLHKVSFFVWIAVTSVHVLAHLPSLPRALRADYGRGTRSAEVLGRNGRALALASALALGFVIAILATPQFGAWLDAQALRH